MSNEKKKGKPVEKKRAHARTAKNPNGAGREKIEIPSIEDIRVAAQKTLGNKTKAAELLMVSRSVFRKWEQERPEIGDIFREQWGKRLDGYLDTAHILAMGVTAKDASGRTFYETPPDPNMLRFMIEKFGKMEGFGDELTIHATVEMGVGVPIARWITDNTE